MDNITRGNFGGKPFREAEEMFDAVWDAIMQFEGAVSIMSAIEVLRIVEHALIIEAQDDE